MRKMHMRYKILFKQFMVVRFTGKFSCYILVAIANTRQKIAMPLNLKNSETMLPNLCI